MNLVQSEASPPSIKAHLVEVQKYFRNHQRAAAKLKNLGGKRPQLPNDTRWPSWRAFLKTFGFNYPFYLQICDEDPSSIPENIKRILDNRQIKEGAAHLLSQLDIVSQSLNIMQSDSSTLGDAMNSWIMLSSSPVLCDELKVAVNRRMGQAITHHHVLAKMFTNKAGCSIPSNLKEDAMDHLKDIDESFPGILAAYQIQDTSVFPASAFIDSIKNILDPIKYWQYVMQNTELEPVISFCRLAIRVLSCPPSSAGSGCSHCTVFILPMV